MIGQPKTDKCPIMNTYPKTTNPNYQHLTNLARMLIYKIRPDVTEKVSKKKRQQHATFFK